MKLTKICEPSLVLGVVSLIISLLIPIAIMLLDSKVSENASEDRWARKVLKKQIIHFDNILNYIILIIIFITMDQIFPQLSLFFIIAFAVVIYLLINLVKKYIDWVDIDGLGNDKAIEEQKALLTLPKYQLSEQSFYWQLFLDYGCSANKNSSMFNPKIFYEVWKKAALNYRDESSPQFYGFCALLANAIPDLKLNYGSSFDEDFYRYCIEKYLKGDAVSKRNWDILTKTLTSYVENDALNNDDSFIYYRCVDSLDSLVSNNLMNIKALDYINKQFIQCILSCKNPYSKDLKNTNFRLTSNDFNEKNETYKQTISLMKQFVREIRHHEYHHSMDTAVNVLFPKADGITIGRLDYLINCAYTFIQNTNEDAMLIGVVNIVEGTPNFGHVSIIPNEEIDISDLNEKKLDLARDLSYQESIKIYAYFYQRLRSITLLKSSLKKIVKVIKSEEFHNVLSKENNSEHLIGISKVYANILQDFIKELE